MPIDVIADGSTIGLIPPPLWSSKSHTWRWQCATLAPSVGTHAR